MLAAYLIPAGIVFAISMVCSRWKADWKTEVKLSLLPVINLLMVIAFAAIVVEALTHRVLVWRKVPSERF